MTAEIVNLRSQFVKDRLIAINRQASSIVLENGLLLREFKLNAYYKEDGFDTFEDAIQHLQDNGSLDYGPRNARHFIAVADLVEKLSLEPGEIDKLGISKLREIASLNSEPDQRRLLEAAPEMSVADVQAEARKIRDHASGRDTDPLVQMPFKITVTQKAFLDECLIEARRLYVLEDTVPAGEVLVDTILPEWYAGKDAIEAQLIEAKLAGG